MSDETPSEEEKSRAEALEAEKKAKREAELEARSKKLATRPEWEKRVEKYFFMNSVDYKIKKKDLNSAWTEGLNPYQTFERHRPAKEE